MTPKEHPQDDSQKRPLEDILRTVRSIDHNVEEILDRFDEHLDATDYDPYWSAPDCYDEGPH